MSSERIMLPPDRRALLEQFQHSALGAALAALIEQFRRHMAEPEPDTSIAWEDGETEADHEARR